MKHYIIGAEVFEVSTCGDCPERETFCYPPPELDALPRSGCPLEDLPDEDGDKPAADRTPAGATLSQEDTP